MKFKEDVLNFYGIMLSSKQIQMFETYYHSLIKYNETTNLTRITEYEDVYYKHYFDSLTILHSIDIRNVESICDMGSGAGFPSLPIKILYPHLKITIIDSSSKRINFLTSIVDLLELSNVELIHDRVELYAKRNQAKFDLVTARAFGAMPLILEMGIPMVKEGQHFIAMKASGFKEEIKTAIQTLRILHSEISSIDEFELPHNYGFRCNINIKKNKHISGYPRTYANIKNKPL